VGLYNGSYGTVRGKVNVNIVNAGTIFTYSELANETTQKPPCDHIITNFVHNFV